MTVTGLEPTDYIAILALFVSGCALALEVRRWIESVPSPYITIMADATMFPQDDGKPKLSISVTNRGALPTTVTHFVVYFYKTWFHRILRKAYSAGFVPPGSVNQIPFALDVNKTWHGMVHYSDDMMKKRQQGHMYVGVACSHSSRTFLKKIPKKKAERPVKEIEQEDIS